MAQKKKVLKKAGAKPGRKATTKKAAAPVAERKKPGPKPGSKRVPAKKILGHEMPVKVQKSIESEFSALQKKVDEFGEHVASFVYNTNTEAAVKAMKIIPSMIKEIKGFKKSIRTAREALKPIFAPTGA
jgi:hypothetical protein